MQLPSKYNRKIWKRDQKMVCERSLNSKSIYKNIILVEVHNFVLFFTALCVVKFQCAVGNGRDQPLKLIEFPQCLHAGCWTAKLTWKWPWRRRCISEYLNGWAPWVLTWIPLTTISVTGARLNNPQASAILLTHKRQMFLNIMNE